MNIDWHAEINEAVISGVTYKIASAFGLDKIKCSAIVRNFDESQFVRSIDIYEEEGKNYFVSLSKNETIIGELAGRNKRLNLLD